MAQNMKFEIKVMNKNSFGADSLIGESTVELDYILQVKKIEDADFRLYYKKKMVGVVYMDLEYKDGSENHDIINQNHQEVYNQEAHLNFHQPNEENLLDNDLVYEYSPENENKSDSKEAPINIDERVIALDSSLSPLEANLLINKTPLWFKYDSSEVFSFDFEEMCYESLIVNKSIYFGNHMRATELPDSSFLITGGENGNFYNAVFHFYNQTFNEKNEMITSRSNHCQIYHKGFVFWFGGINENGPLDEWEAFDMNINEWVPVLNMPRKRFNAGCCKFGESRVYFFGGTQQITPDEEDDVNISEIDFYDISSYEWETICITLDTPLSLPACMQIGNSEILILGGKESNGIWKSEVNLINVDNFSKSRESMLDSPCYSVYPPIYRDGIIYIQNSGTEKGNVPNPMIYIFEKLTLKALQFQQ